MKAGVSRPRDPAIAPCPRCGRPFDCGAKATAAGAEPCWCVAMPALPADALEPGLTCLCPQCLADALARGAARPQAQGPTTTTHDSAASDAVPANVKT